MSNLQPPGESRTRRIANPEPFEHELRRRGRDAIWIHTRGELDIACAQRFSDSVQQALSDALLVVVDLRELTYMDSTGVHALIEADLRARDDNRRLVIVRGPAQINRLLDITGLSDRLNIIDLKPTVGSPVPQTDVPRTRDDRSVPQLRKPARPLNPEP